MMETDGSKQIHNAFVTTIREDIHDKLMDNSCIYSSSAKWIKAKHTFKFPKSEDKHRLLNSRASFLDIPVPKKHAQKEIRQR